MKDFTFDDFLLLFLFNLINVAKEFCVSVHERYWPVVFLLCNIFVCLAIRGMQKSKNELESILIFLLY